MKISLELCSTGGSLKDEKMPEASAEHLLEIRALNRI